MESLRESRQWIAALKGQARTQAEALEVIRNAFGKEADHLRRYEEVRSLEHLRERVAQEVAAIERSETSALRASTKATLATGVAKLAIGTVIGAMARSEEHPLSFGWRLAANDFTRKEPFGTVVVAVGPEGVPLDVDVVSISRYARRSGRSELNVRAALERDGHKVMTPEAFYSLLDRLKKDALTEARKVALPHVRAVLKLAEDAE